jgi:hypothetical protein
LVGKREGKKPVGRFRRRFENNIKKVVGRNNLYLPLIRHTHFAEKKNIRGSTQAAG